MGTPTKDYSVYCGHKYNMLTVLGVKPREFDAKGRYKPARLIVRCDCGRVYDAEAAAVIPAWPQRLQRAEPVSPRKFSSITRTEYSGAAETEVGMYL